MEILEKLRLEFSVKSLKNIWLILQAELLYTYKFLERTISSMGLSFNVTVHYCLSLWRGLFG